MLTLKHIKADGHESVTPIEFVSFDPETNTVVGHGVPSEACWSSGRVFIMNEHGKTVAVYNLTKQEHKP